MGKNFKGRFLFTLFVCLLDAWVLDQMVAHLGLRTHEPFYLEIGSIIADIYQPGPGPYAPSERKNPNPNPKKKYFKNASNWVHMVYHKKFYRNSSRIG